MRLTSVPPSIQVTPGETAGIAGIIGEPEGARIVVERAVAILTGL